MRSLTFILTGKAKVPRPLVFVLSLAMMSFIASAQTTITGVVKNANDAPVPKVTAGTS